MYVMKLHQKGILGKKHYIKAKPLSSSPQKQQI